MFCVKLVIQFSIDNVSELSLSVRNRKIKLNKNETITV